MNKDIRYIAFYLPQYHPIPENDKWWGEGFTEWTNVKKAKPLFKGHYQPHIPLNDQYYDLRDPAARERQAQLAGQYGIDGFCYYHYWFNGKRLLEQPFNQVLGTGRPDFPFCLCWANESWTKRWDGQDKEILMEQKYSAEDDIIHIRWLASVFKDQRYIRIEGKPLFIVYRASRLPEPKKTVERWRQEAKRLGIGDLYLCRVESFGDDRTDPRPLGFDAAIEFQPDWARLGTPVRRGRFWRLMRMLGLSSRSYQSNKVFNYRDIVENMTQKAPPGYPYHRCVTPSWDNTARVKENAVVFKGSTPRLYQKWLGDMVRQTREMKGPNKLVFINAWNEWAEGNHLEPDMRNGYGYLEATKNAGGDTGR